ncbi:hypothetical protein Tco_1308627, partial [Tanacetum coccineum]
ISSVPPKVYVSTPVTTNEKGVSDPKTKEIEPSCVTHIKTPRQPIKDQATPKVNRKNWNAIMERELGEGYSFIKKKCFVCGSLSHLIKDCDYYEKKMAREAAPKKQRVFNTGNEVTKPVWNNADRINHDNHFIPRSVILNSGRLNVNSVRPNVNTVRTNINSVRQNVNSVRPRVSTISSRQPVPTRTSNRCKNIFGNMKRGFRRVPRPLLPAMFVVPPTPPTTQPIPSEATTIPPLSQPAPPTPIAETTTASPSPSPSPAHEPMEHTFEQKSTDQQPPTPRQEATTSQLMTRIGDLEKQLKETKQTFGNAILTLVDRVKTLEVALKRKTKRVLLSDSEEEETEA